MNLKQVKSLQGIAQAYRWTKKKECQHYKHVNKIMQNEKSNDGFGMGDEEEGSDSEHEEDESEDDY